MSDDNHTEALAAAASELAANPRDLDAWWRVGEAFAADGDTRASVSALSDLGRAANDLGAVALSVACALRLRQQGDARSGDALVDRIARTHCHGSKRVDSKQSSVPPVPPSRATEEAPIAKGAAARSAAQRAIKEAAKAARGRAPKVLPPTPLVRYLSAEDMRAFVGLMSMKRYERGDVVVDVGDEADSLFWIARGAAEVSRGDRLLGELRSDAFFGEIALVGTTPRTARVACLEPTDVMVIPAGAVGEMAVKAPNLATVLASHARSRLLSNVMRTSELFRRLNNEEKRSLLPRFETSFAAAGEQLIEKGRENHSLYVMVSGNCEVREGERVVATLSVGDGFGEMSMLARKPANFDVVAISSVLVLRVSRDKFDEIAVAHPELLAEVYKLLVGRERENSDAMIHDADALII